MSFAGILVGQQLVIFLLPFFSDIVNAMATSYTHVLSIVEQKGDAMIQIAATINEPIRITGNTVIRPGQTLIALIHVMHVLVPVVILYSLLVAWPIETIRQRVQSLVLGVPISLVILAFTTPCLLAGHIEIQLMSLLRSRGGAPDEPFLLTWMVFIEMGGRWLFPVAGAVVSVAISQGIDEMREQFRNMGRVTSNSNTERKKSRAEKKLEKRNRQKQFVSASEPE